jgi:hypothetical protein
MKILYLNNIEDHRTKIKQIKKYGKYDKFWNDFANDRITTKDDYRNFVVIRSLAKSFQNLSYLPYFFICFILVR